MNNNTGQEAMYEFRVSPDKLGWWSVALRATGTGAWVVVAKVTGERRAEIVKDALEKEANVRV